jgi:hypothetical protein
MNKTVRLVSTIIFALLAYYFAKDLGRFIYRVLNPKEAAWSKKYTKDVYDTISHSSDTLFQDEQSKKIWADCVVEKLKNTLPNGIESVSKDSLFKLSYTYGKSCVLENSKLRFKAWTSTYTTSLRKGLLVSPLLNDFKEEYKVPFCNCYIEKLRVQFPDGIPTPIEQSVRDSIILECAKIAKKLN